MRLMFVCAIAAGSLSCSLAAGAGAAEGLHWGDRPVAATAGETCIYQSEETGQGTNKLCHYFCASGDAVLTLKLNQACPAKWERP